MPSLEFLHYSYSPNHMINTPDSLATVDTQKLQGVRNKEVEMQPPKAAWLGCTVNLNDFNHPGPCHICF